MVSRLYGQRQSNGIYIVSTKGSSPSVASNIKRNLWEIEIN